MENEQVKLMKGLSQFIEDKMGFVTQEKLPGIIANKILTTLRGSYPTTPFLGIKAIERYEDLPRTAYYSSSIFGNEEEYSTSVLENVNTEVLTHRTTNIEAIIFLSITDDSQFTIHAFDEMPMFPKRTVMSSGNIKTDIDIFDRHEERSDIYNEIADLMANLIEDTTVHVCLFKLLIQRDCVTRYKKFLKIFKYKQSVDVDAGVAYVHALTIRDIKSVDKEIKESDIESRMDRLENIVLNSPVEGNFLPPIPPFGEPMSTVIIGGDGAPPPKILKLMGITPNKPVPESPIPLSAKKRDEVKEFVNNQLEFLEDADIPEELYNDSVSEIFKMLNNDVILNNLKVVHVFFDGIKSSDTIQLSDLHGKYFSRFITQIHHLRSGERAEFQVPIMNDEPVPDFSKVSKWIKEDSQISAVGICTTTDVKDPNKFYFVIQFYVFGDIKTVDKIRNLDLL